MSALPTGQRGRLLALGILLLPLLVIFNWVLLPAWQNYAELRDEIATDTDQLQRYRRIAAELPQLRTQVREQAQQQQLAPYLIAGNNPAQAGASLQKYLQTMVNARGGRILSLRSLKAEQDGAFERVPLNARLQIDTEGLQQVLYQIETGRPLLRIDQINITARRVRGGSAQLDVRLDLSGLRHLSKGGKHG